MYSDKIEFRKLDRDGFCHCCGIGIRAKDKEVFVLPKHYGKDLYYIMCEDCANMLSEIFKNKQEVESIFTGRNICKDDIFTIPLYVYEKTDK